MTVVDEKRQSGELPQLECSCPVASPVETTSYPTEIPTGIAPTESQVYSSGIVDNTAESQTTETGGISSEGWLRDLYQKIKEEADRILSEKEAEYNKIQDLRYGVKQEADYSGLISAEDFLNDPANAHYFDMAPVTDNAVTDAENKEIVKETLHTFWQNFLATDSQPKEITGDALNWLEQDTAEIRSMGEATTEADTEVAETIAPDTPENVTTEESPVEASQPAAETPEVQPETAVTAPSAPILEFELETSWDQPLF